MDEVVSVITHNDLFSAGEMLLEKTHDIKRYQLWLKNEHGQKKLLDTFETWQLKNANWERAAEQRRRGDAYVELVPVY